MYILTIIYLTYCYTDVYIPCLYKHTIIFCTYKQKHYFYVVIIQAGFITFDDLSINPCS